MRIKPEFVLATGRPGIHDARATLKPPLELGRITATNILKRKDFSRRTMAVVAILGVLGLSGILSSRPRDLVVFEEPFTTSGLCHLPGGRFTYKFGVRADAFVDTLNAQRRRQFGQLTCDPFGAALAVGVLARVSNCDKCSDGTGHLLTVDFGTRFVPEEIVQQSPHKVMRVRTLNDPWRLWPAPGSGALKRDVQRLTVRVAELQLRLAADGQTVPLGHARAIELGRSLLRPWNAELLSFAALGVADVPLMLSKSLLVTTDTRERLMLALEALEPLAKELEAKAALSAALDSAAGTPQPGAKGSGSGSEI